MGREVPIADTSQGTSAWNYVAKNSGGHYRFSTAAVQAHFVEDFGEEGCCRAGPKGHNPSNWHIKDRIHVPATLQEGRYLLSWLWDCYMADQIWSNCADVEIVSGSTAPQPEQEPAAPDTPEPEPEPEPEPQSDFDEDDASPAASSTSQEPMPEPELEPEPEPESVTPTTEAEPEPEPESEPEFEPAPE